MRCRITGRKDRGVGRGAWDESFSFSFSFSYSSSIMARSLRRCALGKCEGQMRRAKGRGHGAWGMGHGMSGQGTRLVNGKRMNLQPSTINHQSSAICGSPEAWDAADTPNVD